MCVWWRYILLGIVILLVPPMLVVVFFIKNPESLRPIVEVFRSSGWPGRQTVEEATQLYQKNAAAWNEEVAQAAVLPGEAKFLILHRDPGNGDTVPEYIVYDESDEITDRTGLHLAFWKRMVGSQDGKREDMDAIEAIRLTGHYYILGISRPPYTYQLERRDNHFVITQWNCPTMEIPPTRACSAQWKMSAEGNWVPNYDMMVLPPNRDGEYELQ